MLTLLTLFACVDADHNFSGKATYPDATPVEREEPSEEQPVTFEVDFGGTGTFGDLTDICLPTDGSFTGSTTSEGSMDADGNFVAKIDANASGSILTSTLGCVSDALDIESVNTVTIRASIEADSENCTHYCESEAHTSCEAEGGDASAQAACEAEVSGSCTEECTTEHHSIVAETTIEDGAELQSLNDGLEGNVFGSFSSDLTYDQMD